MDDNLLNDIPFLENVDIAHSPWSGDNALFEDVMANDSNDDVSALFNGGEKDDAEDFDEDTISDPGTPLCMEEISDEEIKNLRVRELNKLLRGMPQEKVAKIRRRRRNLKNRDYALTCRQRRLQIHEDLINENNLLKRQLDDNTQKLGTAIKERNAYKRKFLQLQSACKRAEMMLGRLVPQDLSLESSQID